MSRTSIVISDEYHRNPSRTKLHRTSNNSSISKMTEPMQKKPTKTKPQLSIPALPAQPKFLHKCYQQVYMQNIALTQQLARKKQQHSYLTHKLQQKKQNQHSSNSSNPNSQQSPIHHLSMVHSPYKQFNRSTQQPQPYRKSSSYPYTEEQQDEDDNKLFVQSTEIVQQNQDEGNRFVRQKYSLSSIQSVGVDSSLVSEKFVPVEDGDISWESRQQNRHHQNDKQEPDQDILRKSQAKQKQDNGVKYLEHLKQRLSNLNIDRILSQ